MKSVSNRSMPKSCARGMPVAPSTVSFDGSRVNPILKILWLYVEDKLVVKGYIDGGRWAKDQIASQHQGNSCPALPSISYLALSCSNSVRPSGGASCV